MKGQYSVSVGGVTYHWRGGASFVVVWPDQVTEQAIDEFWFEPVSNEYNAQVVEVQKQIEGRLERRRVAFAREEQSIQT